MSYLTVIIPATNGILISMAIPFEPRIKLCDTSSLGDMGHDQKISVNVFFWLFGYGMSIVISKGCGILIFEQFEISKMAANMAVDI